MKENWFKRWGWLHLPVSWQGAVLAVLALVFCVQVFIAVDRHSHSASDTLYGVFPYFACCFLLLNWVATNTSVSDQKPQPPTSVGAPQRNMEAFYEPHCESFD